MIAITVAVVPALADPPAGTTPRPQDIVGVGSETTQYVFNQFSRDYNAGLTSRSAPRLVSWDATEPPKIFKPVIVKRGCPPELRSRLLLDPFRLKDPKGGTGFCIDYLWSSRGRAVGDPPPGPGGIQFLPFGVDAVTWATNARHNGPANLSTAQLAAIYSCVVTNWKQVGGKDAPIDAQLPQTGSATRKFFLTALGGGTPITPGPCVDSSKNETPNNLPEEDEGVSKFLRGPNVIYPYSVGRYIAEVFHSARCLNKGCTPDRGVVCVPRKGQNLFGCDNHGAMVLHTVGKTAPTSPFPLPKPPCRTCEINKKFSPAFLRLVYVVVRWARNTADNVPGYLEGIFGPKGWVCTNKTAKKDLASYGFLTLGRGCQ